jgi:uncharacterized protein YcfJ
MNPISLSAVKLLLIATIVTMITACSGASYRPVVDSKGVDMSNYENDLVECQAIAKESGVGDEVVKNAAVGAAAGAVLGAVIGAITGDFGTAVAAGAGYGGTAGAVDGAITGTRDQEQIVANCMAGRGYKVLK